MVALSAKTKKKSSWYLYVLMCGDDTLYTGITNDLPRRVRQHNAGTASRYTRSRLPVQLVFQKRCRDRSYALKQEYALKQLSRNEKKAFLEKNRRAGSRLRQSQGVNRAQDAANEF